MQKRHRIFIAINLPEDIKKVLAEYANKWPELPAKWTQKENLHITLEFLGDLTDQELADVCKITEEVAKKHKAFSLTLKLVSYGPLRLRSGQAPKFVWSLGEKSDELAELQEDLQDYLVEKVNFRPEGRGFTPHITLARISEWEFKKFDPEERPEVNEETDLTFTVESIDVMESELRRGGPVYTILESHSLKT